MSENAEKAQRQAKAHKWGTHIRREVDILVQATEGMGASTLFEALATEAVIADDGSLKSLVGDTGYAWTPSVYEKKSRTNGATERLRAAGSSLGRILVGGHPDHRTYLAFLEAIYQVTTAQSYDVAERIELLWDQMAQDEEEPEVECEPERGWLSRALLRVWRWLMGESWEEVA